MSFITFNNFPVSLSEGGRSSSPEKGNNFKRSINGGLSGTSNYEKENYTATTTVLDAESAKSIRGLVEGYGHNFSFDEDLYSDGKGLSPSNFANTTINASGGKFGGYLELQTNGYVEYDLSNSLSSIYDYSEWTLMCYRANGGTSSGGFLTATFPAFTTFSEQIEWNFFALDSDGNEYYNGELGDFAGDFIDVTDKTFRLQDTTNGHNVLIDDLVIFPFKVTAEMIEHFYSLDEPFSNLPFLKINGGITDNKQLEMKGLVNSFDYQGYNKGTWVNNGRILEITLREK